MRWIHIKGKNEKSKDLRPFVSANASKVVAEPAQGILGNKIHKELPLLTRKEYNALYKAAKLNQGTVKTFDFQGYVQGEDGTKEYYEVHVISGLRGGVCVSMRGTGNLYGVTDPSGVYNYDILIFVPPEVQKSEGIVCKLDRIYTVEEFLREERRFQSEEEAVRELTNLQNHEGIIRLEVFGTGEDSVREKAHVLAAEIKRFFSSGGELTYLRDFIIKVESFLLRLAEIPYPTILLKERPE